MTIMDKKQICVVIPIYKELLNDFEIQSVEQCIKVLSDYTIHFVCPIDLNIDFYKEKFAAVENYTYYDKHYFDDLTGYNRLMLAYNFYKAFDKYKYMLLYQTDSYVFRDELLIWAQKGYDYIGGIWFEDYHGNPDLGAKIWYPGNGGLSLRKINTMTKLLSSKRPLRGFKELIGDIKKNNISRISTLKWYLSLPLLLLGYQNNFSFLAKKYTVNEDVFFMEASLIYNRINIPVVDEAIYFSWDKSPSYLYNKYKKLPFACHAWFREDSRYEGNFQFWSKYIK